MPPVDAAGYLIGHLFEIGPTLAAGMGAAPITHVEMRAWQDVTGIALQPWEIRILRRLSADYLDESHQAEKADYPPPWDPEEWSQEHREAVSKQVQMAMRSMIIKKENP